MKFMTDAKASLAIGWRRKDAITLGCLRTKDLEPGQ